MQGAGTAAAASRAAGFARWWRCSIAESVLSVLFPPRCVGCGEFESYLCPACRDTLQSIGPGACPRCGEPGPLPLVAGRCTRCLGAELPFVGARGAFSHQGVARRLVADFKFGGQPVLGRMMADLARPAFADFVASAAAPDRLLVTWVPCHRAAERGRGYNQAEVLARVLASGPQPLAYAGLVRKTKPTKHQKGLGRAGRQQNLRGVFALHEKAHVRLPVRTRALVVVDDVYTTGATAKEVSSVLVAGTGLPVHVFTFSRAASGPAERHD
ncbi:MAG: hypothetical protein A2133_06700 [Actinobacteria bacterium RBG_16_64_13]|nr:MAG: hypothetical protein A2133_06700 [Actinobacteria bacterium RBG_16_64_13]